MEKDANVRAIGRGLAVLKLVNRHRTLTIADIARLSAMPYQTTSRIVDTLVDEGMIERDDHRKIYRPTPLVQLLSVGYGHAECLARAGRAPIVELTRRILWPVTISTRVGFEMMVQASTHRISPKAFGDGEPGQTSPILECPNGLVYLAFCSPSESEAILAAAIDQASCSEQVGVTLERLSQIRDAGFDCGDMLHRCHSRAALSILAVPLMGRDRCEGTVSISFLARVHSNAAAADIYASKLLATARVIETRFASFPPFGELIHAPGGSETNGRHKSLRRVASTETMSNTA